MPDKYRYDKDDRYEGRISDISPFEELIFKIILIVLGIVGVCYILQFYYPILSGGFEMLASWRQYASPYREVAYYYYYLFYTVGYFLLIPLAIYVLLGEWINFSELTPYPNLNFVLAIISYMIYTSVLIYLAIRVKDIWSKVVYIRKVVLAIIFVPAIFLLGWTFLVWLFKT